MPNFFDLFRAPEAKASRTAKVLSFESGGRARWTPRDYAALAREGYLANAIVHRAVRVIAENAASCQFLLYEGAMERDSHPLLQLLAKPNPRQDGASFFETLYSHMLLAGNAYVEGVALDNQVRELYALRPDRMKVVPGSDGWPEGYEYGVGGRSVRFDQMSSRVPPILHLTFFHPLDDHYGLAPIEAAAVAVDAAIQIGVADMNLIAPPPTPADGERHVVASGATGAWAGQAKAIATWEDGTWRFLVAKPGWLVWSAADNSVFVFDGASWSVVSGGGSPSLDNVSHVGINSTATDPILLSVKSNAALFNSINIADGGTGDARIQISKESSARTASVVFSDAFSGRAEFGLIGSDDFKLKVSHDGTTFVEAFTIDQTSGNLALPRGLSLGGVISPAQITANQNDYNPAGIASASVLQISSDASRTISGLAGGGEGRIVCVLNVGSQTVTLADESASSSAANRFTLGGDLTLMAKQGVILRYDGTASRWFALARSGGAYVGREVLTANRTYHVRTDGNDSNNGLANTSGGAFLTIQKAIDVVLSLDISIYDVTIQVADGTYTSGVFFRASQVGAGTITLQGNSGTPGNAIISTTSADAVSGNNSARFIVKDMELRTATSGYCLRGQGGARISFQNLRFGACAQSHIRCEDGAVATATGNYAIVGSANLYHWNSAGAGAQIIAGSRTITLTGTPSFNTFALASSLSALRVNGNTFSGSATGSYYSVSGNSVISVGAAGPTYLPGNSAGSASNGGEYF